MRLITGIMLALALGCGEESTSTQEENCEHYDELYSHSIVYCGHRSENDIQSVFVACNSRAPRTEHAEGCIDDYDLIDIGEGCEMSHVCYASVWTEEGE